MFSHTGWRLYGVVVLWVDVKLDELYEQACPSNVLLMLLGGGCRFC